MSESTCTYRILWAASALVLSLTFVACDKGDSPVEPASEEQAPAEPVSATIELAASAVTASVTVQVELPGGWHVDDFFESVWLPGDDSFQVKLAVDTSCEGACDAASIPANIAAEIERDPVERWSQGSAEPHFQPTVELLEAGELPLGRYQAYRLSYPPAPPGEASARPGTHLECYLHNPGDAFYVALDATATPENEDQIWPVLLESCRGAIYVAGE